MFTLEGRRTQLVMSSSAIDIAALTTEEIQAQITADTATLNPDNNNLAAGAL